MKFPYLHNRFSDSCALFPIELAQQRGREFFHAGSDHVALHIHFLRRGVSLRQGLSEAEVANANERRHSNRSTRFSLAARLSRSHSAVSGEILTCLPTAGYNLRFTPSFFC